MVAFVAKVDDGLLCGIEVLFVGHLYVVLHVVETSSFSIECPSLRALRLQEIAGSHLSKNNVGRNNMYASGIALDVVCSKQYK